MFLLYARMRKIHSKLKELEWSQHFFHYKSMGIFPNAQGQVTHKSLVGFCWISNPSEILVVYLLPARMKKIQSKMKKLEWSQHYSLIFLTLKGSLLRSQWWNLAEIQTHQSLNKIVVLIVCKNEEDPFKIESTRVVTIFLPL